MRFATYSGIGFGSHRPPPFALQTLLARFSGYESSSPRESSESEMCATETVIDCGTGVVERSGDAAMRGEVGVRRSAGRDARAESGEPSGGVLMEEDTEEEPEPVLLSVSRTNAMGFESLEITGERGLLQPWIWSQHSSQTRASRTGESGELYRKMGTFRGGWRNESFEVSSRAVVLLVHSAQKTPPHFRQCCRVGRNAKIRYDEPGVHQGG